MQASEAAKIARDAIERREIERYNNALMLEKVSKGPQFQSLLGKISTAAHRGEKNIIVMIDDGIVESQDPTVEALSLQRAQLQLLFSLGYRFQEMPTGHYRIFWSI